ncbi:MAG: TolC family protein [Polyangiaceae bacterium]
MSETRRSGSFAFLLALLVAAPGCVPSLEGNAPREPSPKTPDAYPTSGATADAGTAPSGAASVATATPAAQATWDRFFTSPDLRALIGVALANNQELNATLQEIVVTRSEVSAREGEYLPKLGAGVGVGVEKPGKYTSQGAADDRSGLPENLGNFTFGLTGSWEVDVWRKLRDAAKAASLRYFASIEARNFMVTQIIAEIARSYWELVAKDAQLDILTRTIDVQTKALEVVKLEKQAGRVTELAVQRFEAEVLKNRGRLFDVEQERVQAENRINFLVGRYPRHVSRNPTDFSAPVRDDVFVGLPSRLLDDRPDVRRAALELEATKFDVKSARAAFYPSLTLDAGVGYRSFNVEHLVTTPESLFYGAAAGLTAPLLNRAAITAQYRTANAKQIQAVLGYERTLLQAFTDVANGLARLDNLKKSYDLQEKQVATLANSLDIANVLFQSARADYMEVLLTRRDSLEAQMELVETKRRRFEAVVDLYQALGGGWRTPTEPSRTAAATSR